MLDRKKMKTTTKFKSGGQKNKPNHIEKRTKKKKHRIRQSLAGYNLSYFMFSLCVTQPKYIIDLFEVKTI